MGLLGLYKTMECVEGLSYNSNVVIYQCIVACKDKLFCYRQHEKDKRRLYLLDLHNMMETDPGNRHYNGFRRWILLSSKMKETFLIKCLTFLYHMLSMLDICICIFLLRVRYIVPHRDNCM